MRIIVTGGRDYADADRVYDVLSTFAEAHPTIIHGGAQGLDSLAGASAHELGLNVEVFPADWGMSGKSAGPRRNQKMVDAGADLCLAFPGGRGTADCVKRCVAAKISIRRVP